MARLMVRSGGGSWRRILCGAIAAAVALMAGCSRSVPPYLSRFDALRRYPDASAACDFTEGAVVVSPVGLRRARGGAYVDLLVSADHPERTARLIAEAIATGATQNYIEVSCDDTVQTVSTPIIDSRDYAGTPSIGVFGSAPQVTPGLLAMPGQLVDDTCYVQPLPVRVQWPEGAGPCQVKLIGDWINAIHGDSAISKAWDREGNPQQISLRNQ